MVKYAVVKNNKHSSMEIGQPCCMRCVYALYDVHATRTTFSLGEIDPADLDGKKCGLCHDDWRPSPKQLPPIGHAVTGGCLNCGDKPARMSLDAIIAVGFGMAGVTNDGEWVLDGESRRDDDPLRVVEAEVLAAGDPDHDWRIELDGPMGGQVYQRHGKDEWNLVIKLPGFA